MGVLAKKSVRNNAERRHSGQQGASERMLPILSREQLEDYLRISFDAVFRTRLVGPRLIGSGKTKIINQIPKLFIQLADMFL